MTTTRSFKAGADRVVTLPVSLTQGTGATRLFGGDVIEIETARITPHARYIRRSLRNGDLIELAAGTPTSIAPRAPGPEGKVPKPPARPVMKGKPKAPARAVPRTPVTSSAPAAAPASAKAPAATPPTAPAAPAKE
jgi:hypothetical protein